MDASNILFRTWDRYNGDLIEKEYSNVIRIVDPNQIEIEEILEEEPELLVPEWIKSTAVWWAEGQITDDEFVAAIEYLIQEKIISVTESSDGTAQTESIPDWVKNNAAWWAEGLISEADFLNGLEYLIKIGIVQV